MSASAASRDFREKHQPPANAGQVDAGLTGGLAEIDRRYVEWTEAGTANPGIDVTWRVREALGASWDEMLRGLVKSSGD